MHIDHVGRIPYLLAAGFEGPIICSESSVKLLPIVLEDAFKLSVSRDQKQVERYIKLIEQRNYRLALQHWFTLVDTPALSARIRLQRADHIQKARNPLAFRNLITVDSHQVHQAMVNRLTQTA